MRIAFIIVTYNGSKWISKCLDSISNSPEDRIIIFDNASTDNTLDLILDNQKEVDLIKSKLNLGFGKANNKAIQYALEKYEPSYFFLLNQDAYLEKECLINLLEDIRQNPGYAVYSPVHYNGNGNDLDHGFKIHTGLRKQDFDNDKITEVSFVNAAAWCIKSDILQRYGGFDPIFKHYGEDDNFVNRLKYHSERIAVVNRAKVFHDREKKKQESKIERGKELRMFFMRATDPSVELINSYQSYFRRWLYLLKKNPGYIFIIILLVIQSLTNFRRIKISRRLGKNLPSEYLYIKSAKNS